MSTSRPDQDSSESSVQAEALRREIERLRVLSSKDQSLLEAILAYSPHGILVSDAQGKLVLHNKAAETIWAGSATAKDVHDWGQYRAFHPNGQPYVGEDWSMARALSHRETVHAQEYHIQRFDDTYGVLLGSTAPILGPNQELEGAISIFADITALKRQEEELRVGQERYLTTLRSIGDAVIATDSLGCITLLNPIAEELTGWTQARAKGLPVEDVFRIHGEDSGESVESPVQKVLSQREQFVTGDRTFLRGPHGREIAIESSASPIRDSKGAIDGVVLVFRDVTEKRLDERRRRFIAEANATLISSLDYEQTLASIAQAAVPTIADWCVVDILTPGGELERLAAAHIDPSKVQYAKDLATRYPPPPSRELRGIRKVIHTGQHLLVPDITPEMLKQSALSDEHLELLLKLNLKSALIVPLQCRAKTLGAIMLVFAESGRRFGQADLALAQELAGTAALAVDNASLYREAQKANAAKDEFLAVVSHELRTPLHAILGWANLLQSATDLPPEKHQRALEVIERNALAQSELIDDLLDISRIISGNLRLNSAPVDLRDPIAAAMESVQPSADAKELRLEAKLDTVTKIHGDASRLEQIVWNLLSNAVKFSNAGGKITVRLEATTSHATISVTDAGIGIDKETLPSIFERFRQANSSSTRAYGGLGLGLAIVKSLVALHGGTIEAESKGENQGTTFRVAIPLARTFFEQREALETSAPQERSVTLEDLRVLVVDDERDARELLAIFLDSHGASVVTAGSAAAAQQMVLNSAPDLLVSDIGMPGADGYSLIENLRAAGHDAEALPAVALTAYARNEDRSRALQAGYQAHIAKPVNPKELLAVIASLVEGKRTDGKA